MKAILDKVIVQEIQEEKDSIVVRPDSVSSPIVFGKVVSVGDSLDEFQLVEVDSTVIFPRSKSYPFSFNGEKFLVIKEEDVLAIV